MSKDIKKALEHCIEWNCADCPNREELGSGETVCRGRLLPEVLEYVADLEAKLAEKEKTIQAYEKIVEQKDEEIRFANRDKIYIVKQLNDPKDYVLLEDYKKVEQQLAEKNKEIEKLNACVDFYKSYFVSFQEKVIDELERVKEKILPEISSYVKKEFVVKEFDNQIKQLTHQHEDK